MRDINRMNFLEVEQTFILWKHLKANDSTQ